MRERSKEKARKKKSACVREQGRQREKERAKGLKNERENK